MTPTDRAAASLTYSAHAFEDGLGHRRQALDAAGENTELLCLRAALSGVPSFEFALRERVARLAGFRHVYFGRVRSVERLSDGASTLAVVSDYTPGLRLSTLLAETEARRVPLDINAALCLLRQLVPAVATLHERARDVAHGAIAPERLVLSSQSRLVIVEYVMGAALEQLRYSPDRYWDDLRVPTLAVSGPPRFDQRADVAQLGLVALALILGRPIQREEYPGHLNDLVASSWAVSARGGFEPLPPGLRGWLARALQLDLRNGFPSAIEARTEFEKVMGDADLMASPAGLDAYLAKFNAAERRAPSFSTAPADVPSRASFMTTTTATHSSPSTAGPFDPSGPGLAGRHDPGAADAVDAVDAPFVGPAPAPWDLPRNDVRRPETAALRPTAALPQAETEPLLSRADAYSEQSDGRTSRETAHPQAAAVPIPFRSEDPRPQDSRPVDVRLTSPVVAPPRPATPPAPAFTPTLLESFPIEEPRSRWPRLAAAAASLLVLAGLGVYGWQRYSSPAVTAAAVGTLAVDSNPTGVEAYLDGELRGKTPLTLSVAPGNHRLELRGAGGPRVVPVSVASGGQVSQFIELPKSDPKAGQLQIRTEPAGAKVVVDGVSVGVSPMTVIDLAPGEHSVLLESEAGIVRQSVKVEAGATSSLIVPLGAPTASPSSGWITVAAPFEVQLFEGGRLLGSSRSDRIMVPAGRHDIDLVNDEVGFKDSRTVQVGTGRTAPLRIDAPTGTIALNAVPWAEVWIDGEKVGDTPIGNHALPLGRHDVLFRHPELGEQHHATTVTLKAPTRLSVDMRKR